MSDHQGKPPTLQLGGSEHRHATWTELFYDLAIVVAVAVFGHHLSAHLSWHGLAEFTLCFVALWWAWAGMTFYADRFDTDDTLHRVLFFVQMAGIAGMAIFAHDAFGLGFAGFAVSYMLLRTVLIIYYLLVGAHHPKARGLAYRYVACFSLALVPWAIAIFFGPEVRHLLVLLALGIDFSSSHFAAKEQAKLPLDISHLPERFGLLTIILLGETIAALVRTCTEAHPTPLVLLAGILTLVIAISIWWLYFEALDGELIKKIGAKARAWVYLHLPFMAGLVLLSIGTEKLTGGVHHGHVEAHNTLFAASAFALCIGVLATLEFLSKRGSPASNTPKIRLAVRAGAVAIAALPLLVPSLAGPLQTLVLYAALGVGMVTIDRAFLARAAAGNH